MNADPRTIGEGRVKPFAKRKRRAMADCPHCGEPGIIRSSELVTALHRDFYFTCSDPKCGHGWKAQLSFVHTISMPSQPREGLQLPISPARSRKGDDRPAHNGDPPMIPRTAA
ncbi:MAG: ogr/Delta-like zinc finger family protein [Pseudomonadota bacterium]